MADSEDYLGFDKYQDATRRTAVYPNALSDEPTKASLTYCALSLCGEAGELANKVKKYMRGDLDAMDGEEDGEAEARLEDLLVKVQGEIGDCLWYLARIADEMQVPLSVIVVDNLDKLMSRQRRGKLAGDGDDR